MSRLLDTESSASMGCKNSLRAFSNRLRTSTQGLRATSSRQSVEGRRFMLATTAAPSGPGRMSRSMSCNATEASTLPNDPGCWWLTSRKNRARPASSRPCSSARPYAATSSSSAIASKVLRAQSSEPSRKKTKPDARRYRGSLWGWPWSSAATFSVSPPKTASTQAALRLASASPASMPGCSERRTLSNVCRPASVSPCSARRCSRSSRGMASAASPPFCPR